MGRYMGIDYGVRRIGIALSDVSGRLAFPNKVIENHWESLVAFLSEIIEKEGVEGIVIGLPLGLHGQDTVMTRTVREFAVSMEERFRLPIILENEALSTKAVRKGTVKTALIDAASAALILQGYLDKRK